MSNRDNNRGDMLTGDRVIRDVHFILFCLKTKKKARTECGCSGLNNGSFNCLFTVRL